MDPAIYNVTYSNASHGSDVSFLSGIVTFYRDRRSRDFFVGLCYYCNTGGTAKTLHRCGGCQLVSYCSRECQKIDRSNHKYICKEFPVVNENNVLHTKIPWKEHIDGLLERAAQLPQPHAEIAKFIFHNPRVCHTCRDPRPGQLKNCDCVCVSYCSKKCAKADKQHAKDCDNLEFISRAHFVLMTEKHMQPTIKNVHLCEEFTHASHWGDVILPPKNKLECQLQALMLELLEFFECLFTERLSYTMSLLYALQTLPGRRLGQYQSPLEDLTSLCIHVVISCPSFDSLPWEAFLHRLPKLKQLKVVFILQGKVDTPPLNLISWWILQRCQDCKDKNRVITYSIQTMWYHMFFSSMDYTEPDIVVIYGNTQKMLTCEEDNIHSEISYRNMTDSRKTVLVLTDTTKELVEQGARAVNAVRPVEQLVSPQINALSGFSSFRTELDSKRAISNEKYYFTCIKRK